MTTALGIAFVLVILAITPASANSPELQWGFQGPGGYYGLAEFDYSDSAGPHKVTLVIFAGRAFSVPFPAWLVAAIGLLLPFGITWLGYARLRAFKKPVYGRDPKNEIAGS